MNLLQFIGIALLFVLSAFLIFKHKKEITESGKYSYPAAIITWIFFLFVIVSNSGILKTQLPEEFGGGAKHKSQLEEKIEKQIAPKFKNADRDYKKEGQEALSNSLK